MVGGAGAAYRGGVMKEVLRPWRETSTWWSLTHVLLDAAVGSVTFTVVITLAALSLALLITFPLALPCVWGLFVASRAMSAIERSRLENLLGKTDDTVVRQVDIGGYGFDSPVVKQYGIKGVPAFELYDAKGELVADGQAAREQVKKMLAAVQ